MDSPLLSYIDVWHANFLTPSLTVGEARDLDPRYTTANSIAPVRDDSAERVSQSHRVHILVGESEAPVQVVEPAAIELVNSSETEFGQGKEMVTRCTLTIDWF